MVMDGDAAGRTTMSAISSPFHIPWLCRLLLLPFSIASFALFCAFLSSPSPPSLVSVASSPHFHLHPPQVTRLLQVPQISWGLNNQKIALARALLTARFLNRSLLLPFLSSSLTYKDTSHIQPLPFDHLFSLTQFQSLCEGFVSITKPSAEFHLETVAFNVTKGSGRRWTKERDLKQLLDCRKDEIDRHALVRFSGKNPFLWHDHWPVRDYARVFQCLVLVENISAEVDQIVSRLQQTSIRLTDVEDGQRRNSNRKTSHDSHGLEAHSGYVAVHMRIEKDWIIHCRNTEERERRIHGKTVNICSSKQQIIERVGHLPNLKRPSVLYLAVADILLEDSSLLEGWEDGLIPFEKKKLGLVQLYKKYPYLIQSALDYEVCLRAGIFVGNSFSTFSSLIVLERTLRMLRMHPSDPCEGEYVSYAYNVHGIGGSPQQWITNLSDVSLQAISYGTDLVSCDKSSLMMPFS